MMNEQVRILTESLASTLESHAFVASLPADEPYGAPHQAMLVCVVLNGPFATVLELVAGRELARLLAANLLGATPDDLDLEERGEDALKELLNVTAGAILRMNIQRGACCQEIGIPKLEIFDAQSGWEDFTAAPETVVLDAEGNTVAIRMRGAA